MHTILLRPLTRFKMGWPDAYGVSKDAYRDARKKVKTATGLDIELARSPELQAAAFTTIRQLFERGLGFKTYEEKWGLLVQSALQGSI